VYAVFEVIASVSGVATLFVLFFLRTTISQLASGVYPTYAAPISVSMRPIYSLPRPSPYAPRRVSSESYYPQPREMIQEDAACTLPTVIPFSSRDGYGIHVDDDDPEPTFPVAEFVPRDSMRVLSPPPTMQPGSSPRGWSSPRETSLYRERRY
jgi:hypothetical protein